MKPAPRSIVFRSAIAAILLLGLLAGCGGGDPEPDVPTPHIDCVVHPERCK